MAGVRSDAFALLVACAGLICACTFDTSGVVPPSWTPRPRDTLWLVDATVDATVVSADRSAADHATGERSQDVLAADALPGDALPPDTLPPDTTPPDTLPPDTLPPDTTPPSCGAQYGHVKGYKSCGETPTMCRFYFAANASCNTACASGGGTCMRAAAEKNDSCTEDYETSCGYVHGDGLCTCTR